MIICVGSLRPRPPRSLLAAYSPISTLLCARDGRRRCPCPSGMFLPPSGPCRPSSACKSYCQEFRKESLPACLGLVVITTSRYAIPHDCMFQHHIANTPLHLRSAQHRSSLATITRSGQLQAEGISGAARITLGGLTRFRSDNFRLLTPARRP